MRSAGRHNSLERLDGSISNVPGSTNTIPVAVVFSMDLRHLRVDRQNAMEAEFGVVFRAAVGAGGCSIAIESVFDMPAAEFASSPAAAIAQATSAKGLRYRRTMAAVFMTRCSSAGLRWQPCSSCFAETSSAIPKISHGPRFSCAWHRYAAARDIASHRAEFGTWL